LIVELPGVTDSETAIKSLGETARLEFREMDESATGTATLSAITATKPTGVTGKDLKKAEVSFDQQSGAPVVSFEMTEEGTKKFADLSSRLVGQPLAIFLDDRLLGYPPTVKEAITSGQGVISGGFTRDQAKQLALQLSAGALPTSIKVVEQRNIGALLGAASIEKSIRAGVIGLTLVALFMIIYYGILGVIATFALAIYGLVTFSLFRLIPVTLTLAGIAGFILSIGMAVDSNILIFERIKEELRKGKPWKIAMELGFGRAWDSIRDANFTTLITAFILYNPLNWSFLPASGMVRGFALTLTLGVVTGLFTGIIVSRNLIRLFYRPKELVS
ncbi:MAG: protein translocase subunit SecD, partial [Patescibacteria group bacterium]